jgi:DNA-binding beta-propeller fold protein YncE
MQLDVRSVGSRFMGIALLGLLMAGANSRALQAADGAALALTQSIPLADVRGRIDHLAIDVDDARLFVAALASDSVEVIDLRAATRVARLTGLQEPQGVAYQRDTKRLFAASGRGGTVTAFTGSPLVPVQRLDGLDDADNVRLDADGHLYVGYGSALAILDAATLRRVGNIALPAHPESFQLERGGDRAFVNVPDAGEIAIVDRRTRTVVGAWRLDDARANFPMALDELNHRLFVATRRPGALLVYDTGNGKRIARLPIAGDADDLFFDAARRRVYVVCGEGKVEVIEQRAADRYERAASIATAQGARTGLYSAERSELFVAVPARSGSPAEIRVYRVQ